MSYTGRGRERHPRLSLFVRTQSAAAASLVLLLVLVGVLGVEIVYPERLVVGTAIVGVATIAALVLPWERWPPRRQAATALVDLVGIAIVATALYGRIDTVAALAVFPAVWMAVAAGRAGMVVGVAGACIAAILPILTTPGVRTAAQWASALLFVVVVPVLVVVARILTGRYENAARQMRAASAERNAATAESERLGTVMRSFAEQIELGLVVLDEDGRSVLYNDAVLRFGELARYDGEAGSGSRVFADDQVTPLPPDDQPLARLRRGETIEDFLYWVGPRGGQHALVANGGAVARSDGTPAGAVLVVQDVTALVRAGRTREDALATLAHELRTPLTSIVGYTDLLLFDDLPAAALERVEVIARNADHLLSLTATFLDGLHRDSVVHRERWCLRDLVDASVDVLLTTPGFADRCLEIGIDDDLLVTADREGIVAVLTNLLGNAVKFSRPADRIRIVAGEDPEYVSLTVHNTGSCIDPEDLERIFDRFYRGGNAQRAAVAGTGIGLSVSRDIVQAHGGTLTADRADDGASFRICLPRD